MIDFAEGLEKIHADGVRCVACPLHETRNRVVVYRGSEDRPEVLFVGQSPGTNEDKRGIPFVGAAGKELEAKIAEAPLRRPWGIVNLILCHPPENRFKRHYAEACAPFMLQKLRVISPAIVVALGNDAAGFFEDLGFFVRVAPSWMDGGRTMLTAPGIRPFYFFPTLHPAALLYNPGLRGKWDADWIRLRELAR